MSAQVVRLASRRKAPVQPDTSPLFEQAWFAFPETGRLRSSRKEAWPEWSAIAREIGEEDLLARVQRYTAEDREHRKECGPPAFHRWLKWGRWEHWAPRTPTAVEAQIFSDPILRASFHLRFKDDTPRNWFDRAKLVDGWLVCLQARAEWINGPFKKWAVSNGIEGIKFR